MTVTIPRAVVQSEIDRLVFEESQKVNVDGFRPGKAPPDLVASKLDMQAITSRAFESMLPRTLAEVLKSENIIPLDYPRYVITQNDPQKDIVYRATVPVKPEVSVGDYQTIRIQKGTQKPVDENEIQTVLTTAFARWKKQRAVAQPNDPLGPDDAFAALIGAKDLTTLRAEIRTELESRARYTVEKMFEDALLDALLAKSTLELPDVLVEEELSRMMGRLQEVIRTSKMSFEEYLQKEQKSVEELKTSLRPSAERNVKIELMLQKIGELQNIQATKEEIAAQFTNHPTHEGHNAAEEEAVVSHIIRQSKTLQFLKDAASKTI